MADSKDKNKDLSSENKADKLDEMLNQVKSQIDEIDEFGDDTVEQLLMKDDFDNQDLDDLIDTKSNIKDDEFSDKTEQKTETKPDDLVIENFDISADENAVSIQENDSVEKKEEEVSSVMEELDGQITQADELLEKVVSETEQESNNNEESSPSQGFEEEKKEFERIEAEITGVHAQISQIWADNEDLKEQIAVLSTKATDITDKDSLIAEQLDKLQKEQQKFAKSIKNNDAKPPMLTYIALGLALLSLLTGGILGAMGFGASSDVAGLTELVATLEEEVEILTANSSKTGIKQIDEKIKLLIAKDDFLNSKLDEVNNESQTVFLKPLIDDLVKQSNLSKQSIEHLTIKVDQLGQKKPAKVVKKTKTRTRTKTKAKKATVKKSWVVNLVSFRQKWYAKNKLQEFKKKDVTANLIEVKVKGETWYRLRVKGFKNKNEASAYAAKVKKLLNLGSVWVTEG